jgi:hypothetical protein
MIDRKDQRTTKYIDHKGFIGYSNVFAREYFRIDGQETAPQSLTANTLERWGTCLKKSLDTILSPIAIRDIMYL